MATGIAISGYGVGIFIFAPLANALLSEYLWKGTILIEAGILLNCVVCGVIFRPLKITDMTSGEVEIDKLTQQVTPVEEVGLTEQLVKTTKAEERTIGLKSLSCPELSPRITGSMQCSESPKLSTLLLVDQMGRTEVNITRLDYISRCQADRCNYVSSQKQRIIADDDAPIADMNVITVDIPKMTTRRSSSPELSQLHRSTAVVRGVQISECENSANSSRSPRPTARMNALYVQSLDHNPRMQADFDNVHSTSSLQIQPVTQGRFARDKTHQRTATKTMDFRLLLDVVFIIFATSNFLTGFGYVIPFIFLANRGLVLGFDSSQSAWLVFMIGISNIIGRVVTGLIANLKCVNKLVFYDTAHVIWGISTILSVLLQSFLLQMCYSFIFGFINGTY